MYIPGGDPHHEKKSLCTWAAVYIPRAPCLSSLPLKADHHQPVITQNHRIALFLLARAAPPSHVFEEILNDAIPRHGPLPALGCARGGGSRGVEARRGLREGRVGVREDEIDHFRDVGRFKAGISIQGSVAAVAKAKNVKCCSNTGVFPRNLERAGRRVEDKVSEEENGNSPGHGTACGGARAALCRMNSRLHCGGSSSAATTHALPDNELVSRVKEAPRTRRVGR